MSDEFTPNQRLINDLIHDVPDWPKPGVVFKDITPLLAKPQGLRTAINELVALAPAPIDLVVGMEARGFIFAAPVALRLGAGFVPVRKPGKLPGEVITEQFTLEYGQESLSMQVDALWPGARVMIIDDILATGGTMAATAALVKRGGAELVHVAVLMELGFLDGRQTIADAGIDSFSAVVTV
ncbi:adenine phosphoribosyltransferase [Nigerium massiliense]|uniref:adenine phosphoribosyltransferase n=1 Tax=Nigerium massiliense TaxID=1522317 RepID=UPI00058D8B7C|nr:adenine phosphoribosyltransferase [Nigerium massiliense]